MTGYAVGCDPGAFKPAHVLIGVLGTQVSGEPFHVKPGTRVFVEDQFARAKSARASLMTLSRYAGMSAGAYLWQGALVHFLKPEVWRGVLLPSHARCDKIVFQNHARRAGLVPDTIWALGPDEIDAYLICRAGMALKRLPKPLTWIKPK